MRKLCPVSFPLETSGRITIKLTHKPSSLSVDDTLRWFERKARKSGTKVRASRVESQQSFPFSTVKVHSRQLCTILVNVFAGRIELTVSLVFYSYALDQCVRSHECVHCARSKQERSMSFDIAAGSVWSWRGGITINWRSYIYASEMSSSSFFCRVSKCWYWHSAFFFHFCRTLYGKTRVIWCSRRSRRLQ